MSKLFTPYNLSGLALKNRVVMAPMTRTRTMNDVPDEVVALYYAQRASAGLLITELLVSDFTIGGVANLLAATLIVWLGALISGVLLPKYVFPSLAEAKSQKVNKA